MRRHALKSAIQDHVRGSSQLLSDLLCIIIEYIILDNRIIVTIIVLLGCNSNAQALTEPVGKGLHIAVAAGMALAVIGWGNWVGCVVEPHCTAPLWLCNWPRFLWEENAN